MTNPWFKFFGGEWLSDPKRDQLTALEQNCLTTLLCYANISNQKGKVPHVTEQSLMIKSGIIPATTEWEATEGVIEKFKELGIVKIVSGVIIVKNWEKRQETSLTEAERAKRYRNKKRHASVTSESDESHAREEKKRGEKKRIEKKIAKPEQSISFLSTIPTQDLTDLSEKYKINPAGIKSKAYDLKLYCEQKGKVYRNYRSFLENAIRSDKDKLQNKFPYQKVEKPPPETSISPEEQERIAKLREGVSLAIRSKKLVP